MKTFSKNLYYFGNSSGVCKPDFRILNISYIQALDNPAWEFPMHSHDKGVEITVILKGHGLLYFNGEMLELKTDDIIITDEQSIHAEFSDHSDPIEQITMLFDGIQYKNKPVNNIITDDMSPILKIPSIHVIRSMAFHIRHLCLEEERHELLPQISRAFVETVCSSIIDEQEALFPAADYSLIRNVRAYVDDHYNEELSLKGVANLFYIDHYYLAHRFKDITGFSFRQYIINRRIGEAERMLLFEDKSIEEVSRTTGYKNLQYFYSAFRKYVGCTPAEFRNQYR